MKWPAGAKSFPVPLYGGRVVLCVTRDAWQQVAVLLDSKPDPDIQGVRGIAWHAMTKQKTSRYVVGVFADRETTLVHEIAHAAFQILRHADVRISHANDEAYAYLIETLHTRASKAMRELIKRDSAPPPFRY